MASKKSIDNGDSEVLDGKITPLSVDHFKSGRLRSPAIRTESNLLVRECALRRKLKISKFAAGCISVWGR